MKTAFVSAIALVTVVGCGGAPDEGSVGDGPESPGASIAAGIDPDSLLSEITVLASDEFGGRAPGSPGEALTIDYLTEQFSELGLMPGNPDGTWVQAVPLVGITPQAGTVSRSRRMVNHTNSSRGPIMWRGPSTLSTR